MKLSYQTNIIIRLVIIVAAAFSAGILFFIPWGQIISIALLLLLLIMSINLFHYLNTVNSRINYFFEAIINEDFSLVSTSGKGDKIVEKLNRNLSEVNRKMQQIKLESMQQEQYLRALIEHIGTGILTYDDKGFVIHANSSMKGFLGLKQLTHLKQIEKVDFTLANALRQMRQHEQRLITIDGNQGKITLLIKATSFKSGEQRLTLLSVQDIGQELSEKEVDSWMKLIRVLTHEIMNAIAPVTSLSETLSSYYVKDGHPISSSEVSEKVVETTIRGLEIIKEQGKGLITFVEGYRKFTRLPKPEKAIMSVSALLEKTVVLSKSGIINSSIHLAIKQSDADLQILADDQLITQVLINLIKNAAEALDGKAGSKICLSAGSIVGGKVDISVTDNGPGIPEELLEEIFIPFFTTRAQGNGIGLSLSRQIMRLHGGSLKVRSTLGKETIFTLRFGG